MGRVHKGLVCGLAWLLLGEATLAATFRVEPIHVFLGASVKSTLVTVTNESQETIRFQVRVFAWDQNRKGEMKLEPTEEVVFFPKLFTLDPGKAQKIRVGVTSTPLSVERTFRMFVEELPPVERPTPEAGTRVRVLTKMGIPIFVEPPEKKPLATIDGLSLVDGELKFSVENQGNVHFSLFGVKVTGLRSDGSAAFDRRAEGWYVLAKGARDYQLKISPEDCGSVTQLVVEAETDIGALRAQVPVDPQRCSAIPSANPAAASGG